MGLLSWLESTAYSEWILYGYGWQVMLTGHALGLAIVVGIVLVLDLRLLGLFRPIPLTSLHGLLGLAWIGIATNIFTGVSIFMSQATMYITSVPFLIKITLIILGIVNVVYMRKTLLRDAASWQSAGAVASPGIALAASSMALWTGAVVTGRLIAYL